MRTKWIWVILIAVVAMQIGGGCNKENMYWKPGTKEAITVTAHEALPEAEKADYVKVEAKFIKPEIVAKGDAALAATTATVEIVRPFLPEPIGTGLVAVLGGLAFIWERIKRKRIRDRLAGVELGGEITRDSVDALIRPSLALWKAFKKRQEDKADHTIAIMPDAIDPNYSKPDATDEAA